MPLDEYRSKRNFEKTTEPQGELHHATDEHRYVIHKHQARRLHYDLRLELHGVLKSWAIPKGPSLNPVNKRLAVHVEDHPIEYADFEGIIPEGQYGGGTVMLWDNGYWTSESDPAQSYEHGIFKFFLHGHKLTGGWVLIRINSGSPEHKNWLFIKENDSFASRTEDITATRIYSVQSGKDIDQIRDTSHSIWDSNQHIAIPLDNKDSPILNPSQYPGINKAGMPQSIIPQSAQPVKHVPEGNDWFHEIKYDGYRLLCFVKNHTIHLYTRNHNDWTDRFRPVVEDLHSAELPDCILDGEIVVHTNDGLSSFQALQNSMKGISSGILIYYLFDILHFESFQLMSVTLHDRKSFLKLFYSTFLNKSSHIRLSEHFTGNGPEVFRHACSLHYEGIISKFSKSIYEQRRTATWLKIKCVKRQEFIICGFTEPSGGRHGFGALHLGYYSLSGELVYCGKVGTGFNETLLTTILPMLVAREQSTVPFRNVVLPDSKINHWIQPTLVAEIEYLSITDDGYLRHPSFIGLREDKRPDDVHLEQPVDTIQSLDPEKTPMFRSDHNSSITINGVSISNPEKNLYDIHHITKKQLAQYYDSIADLILPFICNRPLVLVRCPGGLNGCFYQKHFTDTNKSLFHTIAITEQHSENAYCYVDNIQGILSLVQLSVLEIHIWNCTVDTLEHPDQLVFDLDPGQHVDWKHIVECAILLKKTLALFGLVSFVKLSGGKGLHIVAPLQPSCERDIVTLFSKKIATLIASQFPDRFVATMGKKLREGKIFIDYIRNSRGATTICPYSTRARAGCAVSLPVRWEDLLSVERADKYTLDFKQHYEFTPWDAFFTINQTITREMIDSSIFL